MYLTDARLEHRPQPHLMMPPSWPDLPVSISATPGHCEPNYAFLEALSSLFHVCIPTPLALVSSILGMFSIVSWLFSQLPQIVKNYKLQSASGLSPFFLVEWCLGDSTNLLGAIFARQAGWQITVAAYYVFVDVVLVFQYFWYTYFKGSRESTGKYGINTEDGGGNGGVFDGISPSEAISTVQAYLTDPDPEPKDDTTSKGLSPSYSTEKLGTSSRPIQGRRGNSSAASLAVSPKAVLFVSMLCAVLANATSTHSPDPSRNPSIQWDLYESWTEIAGRVSSWSSTVLYLGSRLPQLYKNYKRKSTSGLSPLLFAAAFGGNLFYSSSLLTNPNAWSDFPAYGGGGWADGSGSDRLEWIGRAIPFFLGSFGVLGLDGAMGVQFLIYGEGRDAEGKDAEYTPLEPANRGKGNWEKIIGLMRVLFPSKFRGKSTEESQSLLRQENDGYGAAEYTPLEPANRGKGNWEKIIGLMKVLFPSKFRGKSPEESRSLLRQENDGYGAV
ncbi:hypothetical protein FQN54_006594 [Arachnomyces sp. PD_36]|nr:hypothetical protein FQN54_006594 [Arachnomyces sp. PD_36]